MATTHQEKAIITLESIPSRGTVLPAPHGKGNKCDKNVKYKRPIIKVAYTSGPIFKKIIKRYPIFSLQINYYQIDQKHT